MENNKGFNLTTPYESEMNPHIPWKEYPRPSMVRGSFICLNGLWDFSVSKEEKISEYKERILVPFAPESRLSGIGRSIGEGSYMHYRRSFSIGEELGSRRAILHFGAVDTISEVYLNGAKLGSHEGGYLPFEFDITDALCDGENELYLRVRDDLDLDYPYGKQKRDRGGMWYTPVSGIWQTVWIELCPAEYIKKIKITTTRESVKIETVGGARRKCLSLLGMEKYEYEGDIFEFSPAEKNLWSPEFPYLYRFTLEAGEDRVESYFALRDITVGSVRGIPRLLLNGEPYLFNGLLDQGYYPDGIFLPATSDGYRDDILRAKECGFNMLRKHIKVEPEIFYYLCDSLGMAVFQDMVNNSSYSFFIDTALPTVGFKRLPILLRHKKEASQRIFKEHMIATMDHLHSFPSILYYTLFNEGWGQFKADAIYRLAKAHDPSRIYDATSGWFYRKESDVDSRHVYFKPVKLGRLTERPIVISEFGGYSHRVSGHLFGEEEYGYSSFAELSEFRAAFLRLYREELKPLISKGISALVYTQVSDVEDETNGILTYDRRVLKLDARECSQLMKELCAEITPKDDI